ncbi:actin-like ATPase domain-containing protein [Dissoconium aciculare CBS 342.82]|uniref:Actin-like ATPase domain-containing protein n=1 Tax=Dissoconium aciculare CBS 342.82 TaxID=1314786 RepID=A0A6J3LVI0_9PEZI|nr:actin-like ATPase domain-containing protein [Dissoconium aciculare CBS 342.82]KAF1819770.1 actin-like ATPase domain-containing protein [Dissoconium aciculare CBS 342.82]
MLCINQRRIAPLGLCIVFLFLFVSTAKAAVLGIDFGTLHIKAALIKPGVPLDIVLTKDSKRKEVAALAFKPSRDEKNQIITGKDVYPERVYGSDALALQGRFPSEVFPNLKFLLGLQANEEADEKRAVYKARYPALKIEHEEPLGATVFRSSGFAENTVPFTVEELVGMELANIKRNALAMAGKGSSVEDVVITIPPFFTAEERRAISRAADYAGLRVNALISDGLAVGLDYAKTRTFPLVTKGEKPEYHLVFDMGAGSTSATLLRFQSRSVKDIGRYNKTVQEVAVLGAGWDRTLGGDSLNHVIMDDFVNKLMAKSDVKSKGISIEEVKSNGRTMGRFFKEAEKARQILSANSETSNSFEEILPDIDLRTKLSRADFEALVSGFADRVEKPIEDALKMAKLTMKDVDSIILHGGAVRTPFVHSRLEKIAGDASKLRNSVNADESAVFGAAFKAAGLSASFKVKEIRDSDLAAYTTSLFYTDKEKVKRQDLFLPSSQSGSGATIKQVTFKDKEDFKFQFTQVVDDRHYPVLDVESVNLTLSVQELNAKFGCEKADITTKFSFRLGSLDSLPEVVGGSVSCEVDDVPKAGSVGDTVKDWLGFGKKKDQESDEGEDEAPVEEIDTSTSTKSAKKKEASTATSSGSADSAKASEAPKKRTESINVQVTSTPAGGLPVEKSKLQDIRDRFVSFDSSDLARLAREEALNLLESFTYYVRDLLENTDYESVSTKAQRDEISSVLQSVKEWMEVPGTLAKATRDTLKEKRESLKKLVDPIVSRRKEGQNRPAVIKKLQESLDSMGKLLVTMEDSIASAVQAQSSAAEKAKTETSTADAAETTGTDDEPVDPEASATATSSASKSTTTTEFNPYASLDVSSIRATYDSAKDWLEKKVAEQNALDTFAEPVLRIKDLEAKISEVADSMRDLVYKQMKAATKPTTSSKKAKAPKTKAAKKGKSTAGGVKNADDILGEPASANDEETPTGPPPAAEPEAAEKPAFGSESIEDLLGSIREPRARDEL